MALRFPSGLSGRDRVSRVTPASQEKNLSISRTISPVSEFYTKLAVKYFKWTRCQDTLTWNSALKRSRDAWLAKANSFFSRTHPSAWSSIISFLLFCFACLYWCSYYPGFLTFSFEEIYTFSTILNNFERTCEVKVSHHSISTKFSRSELYFNFIWCFIKGEVDDREFWSQGLKIITIEQNSVICSPDYIFIVDDLIELNVSIYHKKIVCPLSDFNREGRTLKKERVWCR